MDEYLDAYSKLGEFVKRQERKSLLRELREYSYLHNDAHLAVPVVHLMLTNSNGDLYIVQRGDKAENPFLYDKTVGGHITSGEDHVSCLIRECAEEIGIDIIVADMMNYHRVASETNLCHYAVVRPIDFDPWNKSIRIVKNDKPWVKRDRVVTFAGMYDGMLQYKDGEAVNCRMLSIKDLRHQIQRSPSGFTYDLHTLLDKYEPFFSPVNHFSVLRPCTRSDMKGESQAHIYSKLS